MSNLEEFDVLESYIDGRKVYDKRDGVLFSLIYLSVLTDFVRT